MVTWLVDTCYKVLGVLIVGHLLLSYVFLVVLKLWAYHPLWTFLSISGFCLSVYKPKRIMTWKPNYLLVVCLKN